MMGLWVTHSYRNREFSQMTLKLKTWTFYNVYFIVTNTLFIALGVGIETIRSGFNSQKCSREIILTLRRSFSFRILTWICCTGGKGKQLMEHREGKILPNPKNKIMTQQKWLINSNTCKWDACFLRYSLSSMIWALP